MEIIKWLIIKLKGLLYRTLTIENIDELIKRKEEELEDYKIMEQHAINELMDIEKEFECCSNHNFENDLDYLLPDEEDEEGS